MCVCVESNVVMREFYVRRAVGEDRLRIAVDPAKVRCQTREFDTQRRRLALLRQRYLPKPVKDNLNRVIHETASFRIREDELTRVPVTESDVFRRMKDVYDHRKNLKASVTYDSMAREIHENGIFRHKDYAVRSVDEIESCIRACYLDILLSMARFGYLEDKVSDFATGGMGTAFIDRDGTVLKALGASHRFAAAHVVGLKGPFPLRIIGAHASWLQSEGIGGVNAMKTLSRKIRHVEDITRGRAVPA